jgi:hypothetical protein
MSKRKFDVIAKRKIIRYQDEKTIIKLVDGKAGYLTQFIDDLEWFNNNKANISAPVFDKFGDVYRKLRQENIHFILYEMIKTIHKKILLRVNTLEIAEDIYNYAAEIGKHQLSFDKEMNIYYQNELNNICMDLAQSPHTDINAFKEYANRRTNK